MPQILSVLARPTPEIAARVKARPPLYVTAGNSVAERIERSAKDRDFWETAITVTTSDDDLSKGHAEYLEARLIQLATQAGRVVLDNGTQPEAERRRLPEADVANMEQFLSNLRIILPVIGLDMLKPQPKAVTQVSKPAEERTATEVHFEIRHKSGVQATAVEEDGEFVVLEGSEALSGTGHVQHLGYGALKAKLIEDGVLVVAGVDRLRFTKPWPFSSPSAASAVILDRNSNGRLEWKVRGSAENYHEWQQAQAVPAAGDAA